MSGKIEGKIIKVTPSGDLITDLSADQLADVPRDDRVAVRCGDHHTIGIFDTDHDQPEMTFLALIVDGQLVLTVVAENAQRLLGLGQGEKVVVHWES